MGVGVWGCMCVCVLMGGGNEQGEVSAQKLFVDLTFYKTLNGKQQ